MGKLNRVFRRKYKDGGAALDYAGAATSIAGASMDQGGRDTTGQDIIGAVPVYGQIAKGVSQVGIGLTKGMTSRDKHGVASSDTAAMAQGYVQGELDPLGNNIEMFSNKDYSKGEALTSLIPGVGGIVRGSHEQAAAKKRRTLAQDHDAMVNAETSKRVSDYYNSSIANSGFKSGGNSNVFKNGGIVGNEKTRPVNILTKPPVKPIPSHPTPTLARAFNHGGVLDSIKYEDGGKLVPVGNGVKQVVGDNPNEEDDVALGDEAMVSHGEAIVPKGNNQLVMSNNPGLENTIKPKETYAQSHLKNDKQIKKAEDRKLPISKGTLTALAMRNKKLEVMQQIMNGNSQGELA